jgi:PAS domain S-box-containing protein
MPPPSILIVEDELIVGLYTRNLLERMGYRVLAVETTGEGALNQALTGRPDLILMDIALKERMDGLQTAEAIRGHVEIPIIFSTAYTDDQMLAKAKALEPAGYLLKPLEPRQLSVTVEMALHKAEVEGRLRRSESRFRRMAEVSPFPIFIVRDDGRITYINRRFSELFGYTKADIPDESQWMEKAYPLAEERERVREIWTADVARSRSGPVPYREVDVRCKNGETRNIRFRLARLDADQVMLTCEDLTRQRQFEEELLRTKKLESVAILAGGIAHDFNNLLSVIMGNINLLQMAVDGDAKTTRWLAEAERAAMRARNLTGKFTYFASGDKPVRQVADIRVIIRDAMSLALSGSSADWTGQFPEDLWPVDVDPSQIGQVINNVALNAVTAMPRGGTVHVAASNARLAQGELPPLAAGEYVRITVADTGVGIPPEHLLDIFDPYFTTKRRGTQKGMGFGLPIAHAVVRRHGGHIHVTSEPDAGTRVYIYLPALSRATARAEAESDPPSETDDPEPRRVLVMDDEEMIRELLGQMLGHLGYETALTADGQEAVDRYAESVREGRPFDVVILDLTVPGGMGGKEAIQELRTLDPEVTAVVSSGYATDAVISDFEKWGFKGRIAKPYQLSQLGSLLASLTRERD